MDTAAGAGHLCPVCGQTVSVFGRGPGGRPNAACPHCGSLERHRLAAFVTGGSTPLLAGASALQVGPAGVRTPSLIGRGPHVLEHTLDAGYRGDQLPFTDDSFDLVLFIQVLGGPELDGPERDGLAQELARVLRPGGVAVVHDSADVSVHLEAAGLAPRRLRVADLAGPELAAVLGLAPGDAVSIARPSGQADAAAVGPGAARQTVPDWLGAALVAAERARAAAATEIEIAQSRLTALEASLLRRAERAERAAASAQGRYDALRGRLPLRVAGAVVAGAAAVRRARPLR